MEKLDEIVRKWNEEDNEKTKAKKSVPENTATEEAAIPKAVNNAIEYDDKTNTTAETSEEIPAETESAIKTESL
jgi:hypothetical protein